MRYKGTLLVVQDCDHALQFYHDMFGLQGKETKALIWCGFENRAGVVLFCGFFIQGSANIWIIENARLRLKKRIIIRLKNMTSVNQSIEG